jgi:hypothetical protein
LLARRAIIVDLQGVVRAHFDDAEKAVASLRFHLEVDQHLRYFRAVGCRRGESAESVVEDMTINRALTERQTKYTLPFVTLNPQNLVSTAQRVEPHSFMQ